MILAGIKLRKSIYLVFFILLALDASFSNAKPKKGASETNDMLAAADIKNGRELAVYCNVCHSFEKGGPNKTGPNLFGIYSARLANNKKFKYSEALKKMKNKTWTVDELYMWLRNPEAYAPGTKMSFAGLLDPQDRMDLIAYLMTLK